MKPQDESSSDKVRRSGWRLLGQIELSTDLNAGTIHTWLAELLTPLNLHPDFVNQFLNSAQDAALRAMHSRTEISFEHIRLSVFIPNESTAHGNIWGSFRIEKIENATNDKNSPDHDIEFYLYVEGQ